jgi:hypothetical protein
MAANTASAVTQNIIKIDNAIRHGLSSGNIADVMRAQNEELVSDRPMIGLEN